MKVLNKKQLKSTVNFRKKIEKTFVLAGLLGLLVAFPGQNSFGFDVPSYLEPAKMGNFIKKQASSINLGIDVGIFNGEIFDGVTAALKYKYKSEPSYIGNYYTRYDKYTAKLGLDPSEWVEDFGVPFALGFSAGSDIVFARQFKSQGESLIALPYTLLNLPLTKERAIEKMNVGDFVSFTSHLKLNMSLSATAPVAAAISLQGTAQVFVSGQFNVHIYRLPEDKIRVKLIALNNKGASASGKVQIIPAPLKIVGIGFADKKISKIVKVDPLKIGVEKDLINLFAVDYVFDLKNQDAAQAYENLIGKKFKFKPIPLGMTLINKDEVENQVVTDLSEIESLFDQDKDKDPEDRRIDRIFKGEEEIKSTSNNIQIGLNLIRFEKNSSYSENKVVSYDKNDHPSHFLFNSFLRQKYRGAIFGTFMHKEIINANLLFKTDDAFKPKEFVALVAGREIKANTIRRADIEKSKTHVRKTLPNIIFKNIDWEKWDLKKLEMVNVRFNHQIFFKKEAMELLPHLTYDEIVTKFGQFLKKLQDDGYEIDVHHASFRDNEAYSYTDRYLSWPLQVKEDLNPTMVYYNEIHQVAHHLSQVLNPRLDPNIKYLAFAGLKDNPLYRETGTGFLLSLIPEDQLEKSIYYRMRLSVKKHDMIEYEFGKSSHEELYNTLIYIQNILNDKSIDLMLLKK